MTDTLSYWVLKEDGTAVRMEFNGTSMVENPLTTITGISNPISISVANGRVVIQDGSTFKSYAFDGTSMVEIPALSKNIGSSNPVNAVAVDSTPDTVFIDDQGFTYYAFDGSNLVENPFKTVSGLNVVAGDYQEGEQAYVYLDDTGNVNWLSFDGSGYVANFLLSTGPVTGSVALAVAPDDPYYLVRTETGVKTYMFTGSSIEEVPELSIAGLQAIQAKYLHPKTLQSTIITLTEPTKRVFYDTVETLPVGTSISYEFSNDGGSTWFAPDGSNIITFANYDTDLVYRAVLDTIVDTETPLLDKIEIYDYTLEAFNFLITDIVNPPEGNPTLPTDQKVYVKAGYDFTFEVQTRGASLVTAYTSDGGVINMTPAQSVSEFENTWTGTYATDPELPSGTLIDIDIVADDGTGNIYTLNRPGQVEINGSIMDDLIVNQVK